MNNRPETISLLDDVDIGDVFSDPDIAAEVVAGLSDGTQAQFRGMLTFEPGESGGGYSRQATLVFPTKDCPGLQATNEIRCKGYRYDVREIAPGGAGISRALLRRLRGPADGDA